MFGDLGFQIQVLLTKALLTILDICTKHSKHKTVQNVCLVYLVEKPKKKQEN
jgi:molybdenum cofactor biosynthesis enzyme